MLLFLPIMVHSASSHEEPDSRLKCRLTSVTHSPRQCHGMTKSVKVHRKDQSVNKNAYFDYFGQFRVFL